MTLDYLNQAVDAGLPQDAFKNFCRGRIVLQPHQLVMAAKARECDIKRGPGQEKPGMQTTRNSLQASES